MISGLDLEATVDYTLKGDTENPTIWKLGVIPSYLYARISSDARENEIDTVYKIVRLAVKGWENFKVPFTTVKETMYGREMSVIPVATVDQIGINVISELSLKIMELNKVSEDERKN